MSAELVLYGNDFFWDVWFLDPVRGRARRRISFRRSAMKENGRCARLAFTFYALYAWDGQLVFRAGKRSWDLLSPDVRVEWWREPGGRSVFTIGRRGGERLRVDYRPALASPLVRLDAEADALDEGDGDFLLYVRRLAAEPPTMRSLLAAWSPVAAGASAGGA